MIFKRWTILIVLSLMVITSSCGRKSQHQIGLEIGDKACKCYSIEDSSQKEICLGVIDSIYNLYSSDTSFSNAFTYRMIRCITDKVEDIEHPIKELKEQVKDSTKYIN